MARLDPLGLGEGPQMSIALRQLEGAALAAALPQIADLRIEIFRDFPYLYAGSRAYEAGYLRSYLDSGAAIVIGVFDGDRLVGAATGTPMEDHQDGLAAPLPALGYPLDQVFYCGESVLLPAYRGQGIGHRFFDLREAHARALGRHFGCFCSVIRPDDHPRRPADYRPLDGFWRHRGYAPLAGAVTQMSWQDIDELGETPKAMQFWLRTL